MTGAEAKVRHLPACHPTASRAPGASALYVIYFA
jgi:hypothetical protein